MHFHVWLCITSHQIAMFASFVKGVFRLFLRERGRVIMLSASERMWSPVRPIDWRCWWITWNVQQAIRCCSVCRPVGWTAPIRPDIKRLCSITLEGALYACPMIKSMGGICHCSWGKARFHTIHAFTLSFNANAWTLGSIIFVMAMLNFQLPFFILFCWCVAQDGVQHFLL